MRIICRQNSLCQQGTRRKGFLRDERGMTLLEILVVMVILGLLATLGSIQLMNYLGRAKTDLAQLQIQELTTAVDLFRIDVGRPPKTEEGLIALITRPQNLDRWRGPYLRKEGILKDPWGRLYIYKSPDDAALYSITSFGANGTVGGTGEDQDVSYQATQ